MLLVYNLINNLPHLSQADYRLDGKEELICCSVEGEVRGYLPASMGMVSQQHSLSLGPENKALQELAKRRQV